MPKPTVSETLDASIIMQRLIENYLAKHESELPDGVVTILNRHHAKLIKADERLLQPKPPRTRKPKAEVTGDMTTAKVTVHFEPDGAYKNPNARTGKDKR